MSESDKDEIEVAKLLKSIDFSRQSARHKKKLWQVLSGCDARQLSDDELDMAAGGLKPLEKEEDGQD